MPRPENGVRSTWIRSLLIAPLLIALASCGPKRDEFAPVCPVPALVPAASDMSQYRDGASGRDVTDMVLQGRITNVGGQCQPGNDKNHLAASTVVAFEFVRGPGMQGRTATVPFFVAVSEGSNIYDKKVFAAQVVFPPNIDQITVSSQPVPMSFPISQGKSGAAYTIWAGFQLTESELSANRQSGQR